MKYHLFDMFPMFQNVTFFFNKQKGIKLYPNIDKRILNLNQILFFKKIENNEKQKCNKNKKEKKKKKSSF
jgi:hypothetical protein